MRTKERVLPRILDPFSGNAVIAPFDDASIDGPEGGLRNTKLTLRRTVKGGANAVVAFNGDFKVWQDLLRDTGTILNITLSTTRHQHTRKVEVFDISCEETLGGGIRPPVDAFAVHVNTQSAYRDEMIAILKRARERTDKLSRPRPIIAFMYPRGERADGSDENFFELRESSPAEYTKLVKEAVKIGVDEGADGIKTMFTGDVESFSTVIEAAQGVPIFMAGGSRVSTLQILQNARQAMDAGARGVAIGRNFFNHPYTGEMVYAMGQIVHFGKSPEQTLEASGLEADD